MFNAKLLPTAPSAEWSSCVWWWSSAMRRRDWNNHDSKTPPAQTGRGFSFKHLPKVGPEEKDWSMASSGTTSTLSALPAQNLSFISWNSRALRCDGYSGRFYPACLRCLKPKQQIRHILARHEQGAGFIAQGRRAPTVNRRSVWPVADRVRLPGDRHCRCEAGLHPADLHHCQVSASMIGTDAFQEVDTYGTLSPSPNTTIWSDISKNSRRHERCLPHCAIRPPWPGVDRHPKDVQTAVFDIETQPAMAEKPPHPPLAKKVFVTRRR